MKTLRDLFEDQIKDLFSAESQLVKALPRLAKKATASGLSTAFTTHLEETEEQIQRLQQLSTDLGFKAGGKKCKAMEGLIEEGDEVLQEKGDAHVIDAALVGAAQRVEHYEIAAYGNAIALAEQLGLDDAVELLEASLEEEKAADVSLTEICQAEIFSAAPKDDGEEDEEDDSDDEDEYEAAPAAARRTGKKLPVGEGRGNR